MSGVVLFVCGVLGVVGNILTLIALMFYENKTRYLSRALGFSLGFDLL